MPIAVLLFAAVDLTAARTTLSFGGTGFLITERPEDLSFMLAEDNSFLGSISYNPDVIPSSSGGGTSFRSGLELEIILTSGQTTWRIVPTPSDCTNVFITFGGFRRSRLSFGLGGFSDQPDFPDFFGAWNFSFDLGEENVGDDVIFSGSLPRVDEDLNPFNATDVSAGLQSFPLGNDAPGFFYGLDLNVDPSTVSLVTVPEPTGAAVLFGGLGTLLGLCFRKRRFCG